MKSVAIIGAGITGLTAAFYLKRAGLTVSVYEAGSRVGGAIRSHRENGYLAEYGPNTILETSPKVTQLLADSGLATRRLNPSALARARFLVREKRPIAMPASPLGFLMTDLFSLSAKLALLREPFVPRRTDGAEESVADFVVRRLGREFLDYAIDALVAGIYAGDPAALSVQQAFPKLAALEAKYGSLIKGQILGARERRKRGETAKDRASAFSFDEGLQALPDHLRDDLGESVHLNTSVEKIVQTSDGWTLDLLANGSPARAGHDAVIFAGTAPRLAQLQIAPVSGELLDLAPFAEIRHPPVASVVLGFRNEDVIHPCMGFGMLVPKVEHFKILGVIFSSSLFPNRAPAGHLTLTTYVGGERQPELASLPPDQLVDLVLTDLRVLLGVRDEPTFRHCAFHPKAIPQYNIGYGQYRDLLSEIESRAPGLFFAGHYRDGISVADSIVSGCKASERIVKHFVPA